MTVREGCSFVDLRGLVARTDYEALRSEGSMEYDTVRRETSILILDENVFRSFEKSYRILVETEPFVIEKIMNSTVGFDFVIGGERKHALSEQKKQIRTCESNS